MESKEHYNMYLNHIHRYNDDDTNTTEAKIFEYLWCLETNTINWDNLSPDFGERYDLPHMKDYGVDLVNEDCTKTYQVKKYEGTSIPWGHMCNFRTYSRDILNIKDGDMFLATTTTSKLCKITKRALINSGKIKVLRNDFDTLMEKYGNIKIQKVKEKIIKKMDTRDYQIECKNKIIKSKNTTIKCQLPCGCGKTFIMAIVIKKKLKKIKTINS